MHVLFSDGPHWYPEPPPPWYPGTAFLLPQPVGLTLSLEHCPWHSLQYPCFVLTTGCSCPILIIPALWHGINYPPRNPLQVVYPKLLSWCDRLGSWILLFLLHKVYLTIKGLLHWQQANDVCLPSVLRHCPCCRLGSCCPRSVLAHSELAYLKTAVADSLLVGQFLNTRLLCDEGLLSALTMPSGWLPWLAGYLWTHSSG